MVWFRLGRTKKPGSKNAAQRKRSAHIRRLIALWGITGVVCFLLYRVFLFSGVLENNPLQSIKNIRAAQVKLRDYACSSKEGDSTTGLPGYITPSREVQERYKQGTAGSNIVRNNTLVLVDKNGQPQGFNKTVENDDTSYTLSKEAQLNYLRVETTRTNVPDQQIPAWVMDPIPIQNSAYYFSLDYRSSSVAGINIILTKKDGQPVYRGFADLSPSQNWQKIESHIENYGGIYKSFQIVVYPKSAGRVDMRALDSRQLRSPAIKSGMVSITFDDGWQSVYDYGRPLFNEYSFKTTQYVISSYFTKRVDGYMTVEQLAQLQKEGHEISSHSLKHCDQVALQPDDLTYDLKTSKDLLKKNKLGNEGFAYPYGAYNSSTTSAVMDLFEHARTSDVGFNDYYTDRYKIKTQNITDTTSVEQVQEWTEYAKQHKLWLVLVYHRLEESGEYNASIEQIRSQFKVIKNSGLPVLPVDDALNNILR